MVMVERVLFVCSGNIHRSPTAANMFKDRKGFNYYREDPRLRAILKEKLGSYFSS